MRVYLMEFLKKMLRMSRIAKLKAQDDNKINVLFPIESITRELDYRLMLAVMCADDDVNIYIGQSDYLHKASKYMNGGIYIGKSIFSKRFDGTWREGWHKDLKDRGFIILHLDEEGAIYRGGESEWERRLVEDRVNVGELEKDDWLLTWGEFQKKIYTQRTQVKNIVVVGHPRFDLLKREYRSFYEKKVVRLKKTHGNFILVNTNFSLFNDMIGMKESFSEKFGYKVEYDPVAIKHIDTWGYVGKTFCEYVKLVIRLSANYPEKTIVIRPHPAEKAETYEDIFSGRSNVVVNREGSVVEWLLACDVMLHDGCTTGVEAYFAGSNIISYQPFEEAEYNLFLPNTIGVHCSKIDDVILSIEELNESSTAYNAINEKFTDKAESLLENLKDDINSFLKIQDVIEQCKVQLNGHKKKNSMVRFLIFRARYSLSRMVKYFIRPLFNARYKEYVAYKRIYPGLDMHDISKKVNKAEEILQTKVKITFFNRNLLLIKK